MLHLFLGDFQLSFMPASERPPLACADWDGYPVFVFSEHLLPLVKMVAPFLLCTMFPGGECLSHLSGHPQDQAHVGCQTLLLKE